MGIVIDTLEDAQKRTGAKFSRISAANRVLMVSPVHFKIEYGINPYMRTATGELQRVNPGRARLQWENLKSKYESLGFSVDVIEGAPGFPDMVFAANQSFTFCDLSGEKAVVLGQMRSEFRRGEVAYFARWYEEHGYRVLRLGDDDVCFEGTGDAILDDAHGLIWGGYGPRTDKDAYVALGERTGRDVFRLELCAPDFYHLDTCFSVLNSETVVVLPEAVGARGLALVRLVYKNVVELSLSETKENFAVNCHSPNGRDVICHPGASRMKRDLTRLNLTVHEVDTSEFIKSGGSVFCLKMMGY